MSDDLSARFGHVPVLGTEAVAALVATDGGAYVDATLGGGGYTRALLASARCHVYGFDRDRAAIESAATWCDAYAERLTLLPHAFAQMDEALSAIGVSEVEGVVFDLGVSSVQLDQAARGFSFRQEGPLNMRMDGAVHRNAQELINLADEKDLADIIYIYGDEKRSRAIARAIVRAREEQEITSTVQLADIVRSATGARGYEKIHPATRVFQAIRIFVNDELGQLVSGLLAAEKILRVNGRLAVVTFHSLEDRIVKRFLSLRSGQQASVSRHFPPTAVGEAPTFSLLHKKPISSSKEELEKNPRARSARLRVGVRSAAPARAADQDFLKAIGLPQLTLSPALQHWS